MTRATPDFLDLCESAMEHARREVALRTKLAEAIDPVEWNQIDRELDEQIVEMRIALYRVLEAIHLPSRCRS